jgi:hypothetical protein
MKLILLFVGLTVAVFIAGFLAHFAMNLLRTLLMALFASRRHDEAEKRLSDPHARILEATRVATFDRGTPWFPLWLPPLAQLIWFASGLITISVRYAFRVWWPVLLLAAILTSVYSSARPEPASPHRVNAAGAPPGSSQPRSFMCKEPLPEFTLGRESNPSDAQLATLCTCIWSKLPEGGWEREVSAKIRRGDDPGWRGRGFGPRFGAAVDACGGRSL